MRFLSCFARAVGLTAGLAIVPAARAADPLPVPPAAAATAPARAGLAVVALAGAADVAWPMAAAVYADPSLRVAALDDAHARVLCGESPAAGASPDLRDLADTVAAVRGDDAPSRALLDGIARRVGALGVVVVRGRTGTEPPTARVFLAGSGAGAFDAALYHPDEAPVVPGVEGSPGAAVHWAAAESSLARAYGGPGAGGSGRAAAPPLATHDATPAALREGGPPRSVPFYESPWLWGAIGAAVVGGGAAYLSTRDSGPRAIHLEVQVPR